MKYEINEGLVIGKTPATSENSALVEFVATDKGILIPKLTTTQRNAIASPVKGLLIFNDTTNQFEYYNGTIWTAVGGGGGGSYTASEGIRLDGSTFKLGGAAVPLTADAEIFLGGFKLAVGAATMNANGLLVGTGTLNANVAFQVNSNSSVSMPFPRMTEAERKAIASPVAGSFVFQTDSYAGLYFHDGKSWVWTNLQMLEEHWRNGVVAGEVLAFLSSTNGGGAAVGAALSANNANSGSATQYLRVGRIGLTLPPAIAGRAQLFRSSVSGNLAMSNNCAWYIESEVVYTAAYSSALDTAVRWFGVMFGLSQWSTTNNQVNSCAYIRIPFTNDADNFIKFVVRNGGTDLLVHSTDIPYVADTSIKNAMIWNGFKNEMTFVVTSGTQTYSHTVTNFLTAFGVFPLAAQSGFNEQRPLAIGTAAHNMIVDVYREWFYQVPYHTNNLFALQ